jgi:hypothetical protein
MDYVYVCRSGNNEELRYSIRSVVKNATHNNIYVIGEKPDWYLGNFIHVPNVGTKFKNIHNCISVIPTISAISEDFVLIEDDMFIVKEIGKMPVYSGGSLLSKINELSMISPTSKYVKLLRATYSYITKTMKIANPVSYEIHFPLVMNKAKLSKSIKRPGMPKSVYGNMFTIGGTETSDVKVHTKGTWVEKSYDFRNGDRPIISTEENYSFQVVYDEVLKDMFPNPSKYEKDF